MALVKEVLLKISQGKTIAAISKELDVREPTLRAMLEFMADRGYIEEIEVGGGCAGCPMNRKCSIPAPGERKTKMYALTKETMDYIKEV